MTWDNTEKAGTTWDQMEIQSTEHEGGLRLRKPSGGDVLPAGPGDPLNAPKMVSWLILAPGLEAGQAEALALIVRGLTPHSAAPSAILGVLPAAWLAYQRGER